MQPPDRERTSESESVSEHLAERYMQQNILYARKTVRILHSKHLTEFKVNITDCSK